MDTLTENNFNLGNNMGNIGGHNNNVNLTKNETSELLKFLSEIRSAMDQTDATAEQKEAVNQYLSTIEDESMKSNPKGNRIKNAYDGLKKTVHNINILNLIEKLSPILVAMIQK